MNALEPVAATGPSAFTPATAEAEPLAGLLFDMGDVLHDATAWHRWLWQLLHRFGVREHFQCFCDRWEHDFLGEVYCGRQCFADAFTAYLRTQGLSRAQVDEVEAASQAKRRELDEQARPLPGVRATLARLQRSGVVMGVLTDSEHCGRQLAEHLVHLRLAPFKTVVSSVDVGRRRPDPMCYLAALAALGLPADRVAFVGHDAGELAGAQAVGMRAVAFNYAPNVTADAHVQRFDELIDIVAGRLPGCALQGVA